MALVVAQAVLVRLLWARGGVDSFVNVYGATGVAASAVNQAFADALGSSIKAAATSSGWLASVSTQVSLSKVGVRSIAAEAQPEFLDSGAAASGTGTGDYLPPQTAFVVTMRTALAGKAYRGRTYLGGFTEAVNDVNGVAVTAIGTNAVAWINAIKAAMTSSGLTMAVVSRKLNTAAPVTTVLARNLAWETQRRRAVPGI